jgi:hypothetical protein
MLQKLAELLANVFVNINCLCLAGRKNFVYASEILKSQEKQIEMHLHGKYPISNSQKLIHMPT